MPTKSSACPICGKPADPANAGYPFCGPRCRTQDLANWATGAYSVPVPPTEADEEFEPSRTPEESGSDG